MKNRKKRSHNYPKNRKPRDTSYAECSKLIEKHGLQAIRKIWTQKGMYQAAGELGASPYVIRYLAHKYGWTRPAERAPIILKGVKAGNVPASYYKGLDFSGIDNRNTNSKKEKNNEL